MNYSKIRQSIFRSFALLPLLALHVVRTYGGIIDVKKFGATGDGKSDDTHAVQAAINAAHDSAAVIYFPKGTYLIASLTQSKSYLENYLLLLHPQLQFKGDGNESVIKLGDHLFDKNDSTANGHLFYGTSINNISFENLLIDMNGSNNLVPQHVIKNGCAIYIRHGSGVNIKNITIKNCAGRNMVIINGTGKNVVIEKNNFINGGGYVGFSKANPYQTDYSFVYSEWDNTKVIDNRIEQENIDLALNCISGGVELHGSDCYAAGNNIIGCNPGIYISSSWHPMEKTTVENNIFDKCLRGISFWLHYPMNNITIQNNKISITQSRGVKHYILDGIETPNGNTAVYDFKHANGAVINHLLIAGNTISFLLNDTAKDRTAGMLLHSLQNSTIKNNTVTGMNFGGIILQGSKWGMDSLSISGNKFIDFKDNHDTISPAGYVTITDLYTPKDKSAPGIKNIFINENTFTKTGNNYSARATANGKKTGAFFNVYIAGPQAMQNDIHLKSNNFASKNEDIRVVKVN